MIVNVSNSQKKSRDARRISDIETLKSAFVMYYEDFERYPMVDSFAGSGGYAFYEGNLEDEAIKDPTISKVNFPTYLSPIPRDPRRLWAYPPEDPKNAPYRYAINAAADRYAFFVNFEIGGTRGCRLGAWQLSTSYCGCKTGSSNLDMGWWGNPDSIPPNPDPTPVCR